MTRPTCLAHARPFTLDAWGDARHDDQSHCWTGARLAWRSVDGTGSEQHPELTREECQAMADKLNAGLAERDNPLGYRYTIR